MMSENVQRRKGYGQVCVWPATLLGDSTVTEFEQFFKEQGFDIQYLEQIETKPTMKHGEPVEGTGGRMDQIFAIHEDCIEKFATWRLPRGIRWIEDAMGEWNDYDKSPLYPERFEDYKSW